MHLPTHSEEEVNEKTAFESATLGALKLRAEKVLNLIPNVELNARARDEATTLVKQIDASILRIKGELTRERLPDS